MVEQRLKRTPTSKLSKKRIADKAYLLFAKDETDGNNQDLAGIIGVNPQRVINALWDDNRFCGMGGMPGQTDVDWWLR